MHARADDPHRSARRAVRDGAPQKPQGGRLLARLGADQHAPVERGGAQARQARRRSRSGVVHGARADPSGEGYRIIWVRSSAKIGRDAQARQQRIERGLGALAELQARLAGPKSRLRTRQAVEQAAAAALDQASAERWIAVTVTETVQETYRQEKRGRPGKDTRYRKHTTTRFELQFTVNADTVAYDAHTDGCFPLITNDQQLADAERPLPTATSPTSRNDTTSSSPSRTQRRCCSRAPNGSKRCSAAISSRCCAAA